MSRLNNVKNIGQGQRSLHATYFLMLVIICTKYGKNSPGTVHAVERTRQDVPYFSIFIAKSWLNDLKDIRQGQRSLHPTHSLVIVVICAKQGNNASRTVHAVERTREVPYFCSFIVKSLLNDLEDIGQGQRSLHATHPLMLVVIFA